jgi:peptide deformylase
VALLPLKFYPDPILKTKCEPVTTFDASLTTLVEDMIHTMYEEEGIGLAAPQIGNTTRVCVVDVSEDGQGVMEFINPEIVAKSGNTAIEEGCLSIPGYREFVDRKEKIKVKAQKRDGTPFEIEAEGILSICLQHEIDHLDGILFVDRLSRLKKELFIKWLQKK